VNWMLPIERDCENKGARPFIVERIVAGPIEA
jgi:hypothetical protein